MPQVAIYCRISIEDRFKSEINSSQSIENQKSMLCDYCKERNWDIYDIYCDDGYSGIERSRPEFNRMISDCLNRKVNIVLCKDQSRFSRDTVVIEEYINDKFLEWGIRFIGVADNADSDSESYGTMRLFTSAYNEMYVKDISSKIRKTLDFKRRQGQFIGSFAPYGYKIDPDNRHHLITDENTGHIVKKIFEMYIHGYGYRKIVKSLNDEKIPSPTAYKQSSGSGYVNCNAENGGSKGLWTQSTVAAILRNEMYTGTLVQGKSHSISYKNKKKKRVPPEEWIRIPGTHEAIIDNDTWKIAQERIAGKVRSSGTEMTLSPLSGKVKCALCKKPMKRNVYYNKSRTIKYYNLQCASHKTGAMNCSNTKCISGIILEKMIIDELNSLINQYCEADKLTLDNIFSEQTAQLEKQLNSMQKQHKIAQTRLTQTYKDKLDGIISADEYKLFRNEIAFEQNTISARISEIQNKLDVCHEKIQKTYNQQHNIKANLRFTSLDRTIAEEFIDYIEIGETTDDNIREIHIFWKI